MEAAAGGNQNGGAGGGGGGPASGTAERPRGDGSRGGRGRGQSRGRGRGRGGNANANSNGENGQQPQSQHQHQNYNGGGGRRGGRGAQTQNLAQGQRMGPAISAAEANPIPSPMNAEELAARYKRPEGATEEKDDGEAAGDAETPAPLVIFTDDKRKKFEDFTKEDLFDTDPNIGIQYESFDIRRDTIFLLQYNCPEPTCDVSCISWPDLHRHVRVIHHKKICDLCSRHKKTFTHEHDLFTDAELSKHMKKGDDNPGAVDQSGFKGHPLCSFCGTRFYGDDELYVHCRDSHEKCHICSETTGGAPQYFLNYDALFAHFTKDHWICREPSCLEKKLIVFATEMDLKAHQLTEHGETLSKDIRRDMRTVNISTFDYRQPYVEERRGGGSQREQREGRGRGRGRDPNAEAIPASTAQPLRRDEQAFQRQMAIHSAQSVTGRTFGGQLTAAPAASRNPTPMTISHPSSSFVQANQPPRVNTSEPSQANMSPQDQARALRHSAVVERATNMLKNDELKLSQFRSAISSFKKNAITAPALIDAFFALFSDTSSSALGTLVREVADLYEDGKQADSIRKAWNSWKAINEDYPSLPAASSSSSSSIPLNWAVTNNASSSSSASASAAKPKTSRVLKLKSSTAQSSRSSVSQTRSWGTAPPSASPASVTSSNPFPGLPSSSSSANRATTQPYAPGTGKISTVSWAASSSASGSATNSTPVSRPASRNVVKGSGAGVGGAAFPALPPAKKPQSTIFGYGNRIVRRDGGVAPSLNPWAGGSSSGVDASGGNGGGEEAEDVEGSGKGKKKGNKGKKQVLMNWG
ncbi:related to C2H2 finger domain protein [Rhynchosporium agropyri]|uniref:Related to C2H2 finger domain protein n=1 Tax=Rhynchosporium agropyri TaxID=914238 RepID=A0A1E1KC71_9HELO|nr:related to C2H2 finger domain protein [Rhynchosporium agropyri]